MAEEEGVRAAGDDTGPAALLADGRAVPRNVSRPGRETDETSPRPFLFDLCQSVAADEVPFAKLDRPAEAGFIGVDRLVHVVSVKAQGRLEPGRISRAEARGQHAFTLAAREDRVPDIADASRIDEQLESILSRVTGPRDEREIR